jgi:hypothetical protein
LRRRAAVMVTNGRGPGPVWDPLPQRGLDIRRRLSDGHDDVVVVRRVSIGSAGPCLVMWRPGFPEEHAVAPLDLLSALRPIGSLQVAAPGLLRPLHEGPGQLG